jgi:hypothetical protein
MADMGIYSLWPVFAALDLDVPTSAQAWATHTCSIIDHVSRPVKNDFSYPTGCAIRLGFAARGDEPSMDLFWYDGGMKPRLPEEVEAHDVDLQREGILFVGQKGTIMAGFHGQDPQLFADGKRESLWKSDPAPAAAWGAETGSGGRHAAWLDAVKGGERSPGCFPSAASITDAVNLGSVALRAGKKVLFDSQSMTITNDAGANQYLRRDYREGWEL